MKTTSNRSFVAALLSLLLFCFCLIGRAASDLIVHEWGTFTSVQGGGGALLRWQPFVSQDLPEFVHSWKAPGVGREMPTAMLLSKGSLFTLQRMETPVIYFYSDQEISADVSVRFPGGWITEWYPQAIKVGAAPNEDCGAGELSSLQRLTNSVIEWRDVRVLPAQAHPPIARLLPSGNVGNHYFAARETDSAFLRVPNLNPTNPAPEYESLLFYRGAGDFETPLKVTVSEDGDVVVENSGESALENLFLIEVQDGQGCWARLDKIAPHAKRSWNRLADLKGDHFRLAESFQTEVGGELEKALQHAGLFPREAAAMVNTWKQSWFAEDGVRVLYILPREWTDKTIPMSLSPRPSELVRVMVGRTEIIPPRLERELARYIPLAKAGNTEAEVQLKLAAKRLGRFYAPAHQLALARVPKEGT